MVGVKGLASRVVVDAWTGAIGPPGVLVDATVGLISDTAIREVCEDASRPNVIALLDSNLSALDIYARPVLDLVLARIGQGDARPAVLFSINDGVGSLPVPRGFERLSVVIDLDARGDFLETSALDDLTSRALDSSGGSLYQDLWRPLPIVCVLRSGAWNLSAWPWSYLYSIERAVPPNGGNPLCKRSRV